MKDDLAREEKKEKQVLQDELMKMKAMMQKKQDILDQLNHDKNQLSGAVKKVCLDFELYYFTHLSSVFHCFH